METARKRLSRWALVGGLVLVAALWPGEASACSVCFGAADSKAVEGMNNAILLLLGVVGLIQVGFVKLFLDIRKRSKMLAEKRKQFRLVEGGLR